MERMHCLAFLEEPHQFYSLVFWCSASVSTCLPVQPAYNGRTYSPSYVNISSCLTIALPITPEFWLVWLIWVHSSQMEPMSLCHWSYFWSLRLKIGCWIVRISQRALCRNTSMWPVGLTLIRPLWVIMCWMELFHMKPQQSLLWSFHLCTTNREVYYFSRMVYQSII